MKRSTTNDITNKTRKVDDDKSTSKHVHDTSITDSITPTTTSIMPINNFTSITSTTSVITPATANTSAPTLTPIPANTSTTTSALTSASTFTPTSTHTSAITTASNFTSSTTSAFPSVTTSANNSANNSTSTTKHFYPTFTSITPFFISATSINNSFNTTNTSSVTPIITSFAPIKNFTSIFDNFINSNTNSNTSVATSTTPIYTSANPINKSISDDIHTDVNNVTTILEDDIDEDKDKDEDEDEDNIIIHNDINEFIPEQHRVESVNDTQTDKQPENEEVFNFSEHPEVTETPSNTEYKELTELPNYTVKEPKKEPAKTVFYFQKVLDKNICEDIKNVYRDIEKNDMDKLKQFSTLHEQVLFLREKLNQCYGTRKGLHSHLSDLLNHSLNTIKYFKNDLDKPKKSNGGQPLIPLDKQLILLNTIRRAQANGRPMTYSLILLYIKSVLMINITRKQMVDFIPKLERYGIKTKIGSVIEEKRKVKVNELLEYVTRATRLVLDIEPSLLFNIDESGFIPFVDSKNELVVYDASQKLPKFEIYVDRSIKRVTLLGGISADGNTIKSLIITSRKTIDKEVYYKVNEEDFIPVYQKKGYLTQRLFLIWIEGCLKPALKERRDKLIKIYKEMYPILTKKGVLTADEKEELKKVKKIVKEKLKAVVVMDGCYSHYFPSVNDICKKLNVVFLVLAPHSSHVSQPLDVVIFGAQKKLITLNEDLSCRISETIDTAKPLEEYELDEKKKNKIVEDLFDKEKVTQGQIEVLSQTTLTNQIISILDSWDRATTKTKVRHSFSRCGFVKYTAPDGRYKMKFDKNESTLILETLGEIRQRRPLNDLNKITGSKTISIDPEIVAEKLGVLDKFRSIVESSSNNNNNN